MGTNDQIAPDTRLQAPREERDELVLAASFIDEPEMLLDVLASLRVLEGEIARLEQRGG